MNNAIHLYREGDHVVVAMEVDRQWVVLIKENIDSPFSHIIEPSGIQRCVSEFTENEKASCLRL